MTPPPTPSLAPLIAIDWDSFLPDLIVGVVTGLVVGVILAWTQSRAARKRERREIELRWEALRPRVGALLLDPWDRRVMGTTLAEFASRTAALREMVEDVPLGSWADVLHSDELRSLHEFSKAATELHGAARKFDHFLLTAIAGYLVGPERSISSEWDSAFEAANLVQPFAMQALFASPAFPWGVDQFREIRYNSPIVESMVKNPPATYTEVLAMVQRAEKYYSECTVIVDAVMTRYWYD